MSEIRQVYKSRSEAFAQFIRPGGYPVASSQFYLDCAERGMVQGDKTVLLSDLLAYVREKFEVDPGSGRGLADEENARETKKLELRKLRAEVEAKEKAARKDDDRWMEVVDHETQMAAFAGQVEESLRQNTTIKLSELIYLCGGDVRRAPEFAQALDEVYAAAMTDAVREQVRTVAFEEDEEDHDDYSR